MDFHVDWECPACGLTERTGNLPNRFHPCPKMRGLTTPLVRAGVKAKLEMREREDYIGDELVDSPVMSIVTTRDNGQDVTVFAPTATAKVDTWR